MKFVVHCPFNIHNIQERDFLSIALFRKIKIWNDSVGMLVDKALTKSLFQQPKAWIMIIKSACGVCV